MHENPVTVGTDPKPHFQPSRFHAHGVILFIHIDSRMMSVILRRAE